MVRLAVIGCGKIAQKGHLPALARLRREGLVDLVAVADINERVAKRIAKVFGASGWHKDPGEVARRPDIDAVCICTPTPTHAELVKLFASFGKHVLVEKPLCRTYEEAMAIKEVVETSGIVLSVVQNYRYISAVRQAKKIILSSRLGRILSLQGVLHRPFPIRWTRSLWLYEEGGVIYDHGPHLIDMALWLMGVARPEDITSIRAYGGDLLGQAGFINHTQAILELANGSSAALSLSWLSGTEEFTLRFHGTGGYLAIDVLNDAYVEQHGLTSPIDLFRLYSRGLRAAIRDYARGLNPYDRPMQVYPELISDFVEALEGRGPVPVRLDEAMTTVFVLDEMKKQLVKTLRKT